jgi:DNA-binding CsgD family transcriptional regulator/tetratricopeptide (TPR) repeat protein
MRANPPKRGSAAGGSPPACSDGPAQFGLPLQPSEELATQRPHELLSPRERACLTWVARGKSSWCIGQILSISENTVDFHIKNAMKKLATNSRAAATAKSIQLGLIEPPCDRPTAGAQGYGGAAANNSLINAPSDPLAEWDSRRPTPDRPRVGVLPFLTTGTLREEALGLSISRAIAAALDRFRWFDVIAPVRLSHQPFGPLCADPLLKGKHLDFLLDGAISGTRTDFHIGVRLLDLAHCAQPIWIDHFKLSVRASPKLDEFVAARIVAQIDPIILAIEGEPSRREKYGATGLLLEAIPLIYSMEREKYEKAGRLIARALALDPDNAMAAAWAAYWQVFHVGQGWTKDAEQAMAMAENFAMKAIKLDPENAEALGIYGHVSSFLHKDFDTAIHLFDRALRLNPNLASIWALSSATCSYIGQPESALRRLQRYRDLARFDPYNSWFETCFAIAYTFKGDYEKAVIFGRRVAKSIPEYSNGYKPLIASLGHLGWRDEARHYVDKLQALEPDFTVERFARVYPFKKDSDRERYMMGLRLAGVPDR